MIRLSSHFVPHPVQEKIDRALQPPLSGLIVMAIAGRRSGKTVLAVNEIIDTAVQIPGSRIWYIAPTKEQAYGIAWRLMLRPRYDKVTRKKFPPYLPEEYIEKKREDLHYVELRNGSLIEFKGVQEETNLLGVGLEFVVLDEFPTIPWSVWYDTVSPMLTDTNGNALMIGTPPDPKVHNLTKEFLELYELALAKQAGDHVRGFNFSSFDNPYINHDAVRKKIEDLKKKGRGADAERLYFGRYKREFGLVFPKLDFERHTVLPFTPPAAWTRVMAVDPHPQKPIFALWAAIDTRPKPQVWVYREMEFMSTDGDRPLTVPETAVEIQRIETEAKEKISARVIDPTWAKIEQKVLGQKSVRDQFRDYGLFFREGNRDRMLFFNDLTDRLVDEPDPSIHIFRDCPILWRQLSGLTWDSWASAKARQEREQRDTWKKVDDDLVDCLKMILNANIRPARKEVLASNQERLNKLWAEGQFM